MTVKPNIVVDLDGTLCDCRHREHYAQAGEWDAFNSLLDEDALWPDVHMAIETLGHGSNIILLTGREEKWRRKTYNWLAKHAVGFDALLMRPSKDYRPDKVVKPAILSDHLRVDLPYLKDNVLFVLEDRDQVVEVWRNLGLRCWQVQPGGY